MAFFSSVDVDNILRKEVHDKCKTPSLPEGHAVDGKSYTIFDLKDVSLGKGKPEKIEPYKQVYQNNFRSFWNDQTIEQQI